MHLGRAFAFTWDRHYDSPLLLPTFVVSLWLWIWVMQGLSSRSVKCPLLSLRVVQGTVKVTVNIQWNSDIYFKPNYNSAKTPSRNSLKFINRVFLSSFALSFAHVREEVNRFVCVCVCMCVGG